jgi:MGT family glycosyltransferase
MSTISFVNIDMHGHVNPTLPVVAELVRRGHSVTYHVGHGFGDEVAATGARVETYPPDDIDAGDPPEPVTLMDQLALTAVRMLPSVVDDLRRDSPDLVVHDAACLWGQVAARALDVPAVSSFTTFAFNRQVRSPTRLSREVVAGAMTHPRNVARYVRSRIDLRTRFGARGLPLLDVLNVRQPLNLVYTSREFHPAEASFDQSYRFVGPSLGARPPDPDFPLADLRDPVLYASLGTIFNAEPELLRSFAIALAPLAGSVVLATGRTDPAALAPLPANVVARRSVPQLSVLSRAAVFVTHGGMNSVNEALFYGVPLLVVPQGADQFLVADRVVELGAGLSITSGPVSTEHVRLLAARLLDEPHFAAAASRMEQAQRRPGGAVRAADELEAHLHAPVSGAP